jgi:hypothetical protein
MKMIALFSVFLISVASHASSHSLESKLLSSVHALGKSCIAFSYDTQDMTGNETVVYKNSCPQIQMIDDMSAALQLGKTQLFVMLLDSKDSDGGDLNDLAIFDANGKLLAKEANILAFGNLLRALALTGP